MRPITNSKPRDPRSRTAPPRERSISDRHRVAVVQAEARRLTRILEPFGILRRDQLRRRAGAASWHEGSFDSALHAAVQAGEIEPLPLDFYRKVEAAERSQDAGPPSAA